MTLISPHSPRRPGWICRGCGLPYPCPEGRRRLAAAHQRDGELGTVAYELLVQAVRDLPDLPVTDLFDRFVAWTEPVRVVR
jgi:hypothetical protein